MRGRSSVLLLTLLVLTAASGQQPPRVERHVNVGTEVVIVVNTKLG